MAITVRCSFCGNELMQPGGLAFSPPKSEETWEVDKLHICVTCWTRLFIANLFKKTAWRPNDEIKRASRRVPLFKRL